MGMLYKEWVENCYVFGIFNDLVNRNKVMMNNVKMVLSGKLEPENNTYQNEDSISNNGNRSNTEKDTSKDDNSLHEMWDNFRNTTGFHGVNKITLETQPPRTAIRR